MSLSDAAVPLSTLFPVRRMSPEEFVRVLSSGTPANDWNGCEITGDVSAMGLTITIPLDLGSAIFSGALDLSRCRFERGLDLAGCRIAKQLILNDAQVQGPLNLEGMHAGWGLGKASEEGGEPVPDPTALAASFVNLRVEGCACLTDVRIWGRLLCEHASVTGEFRLNGAHVLGDASFRHAEFGEIRSDAPRPGQVDIAPSDQAVFGGNLDMNSAEVHGDVRLMGVDVTGELVLQAVDIRGSLLCRSRGGVRTRLRKGAWLVVARIRGTVDLGGALVNGDVILQNAVIGGRVRLGRSDRWDFGVTGQIQANSARTGSDMDLEFARCATLNCASARIGGNLLLSGVRVRDSLVLQNTVVSGTVFLTPESRTDGTPWRSVIARKAWLLGLNVGGDLALSGIGIGGSIDLQNAVIGKNLIADVSHGFPCEVRGDFAMEGAHVRGVVELAGVSLHGRLQLAGASIRDTCRITYDLDDQNGWRVVRTMIAGGIDAGGARTGGGFVLVGASVGKRSAAEEERRVEVRLVGAEVGRDVSLFKPFVAREILESKPSHVTPPGAAQQKAICRCAEAATTELFGNLLLTGARVGGDVRLDGVFIHGMLDLRDATVRGNTLCRPVPGAEGEIVRATMYQADFETLETTGDIDLTGLTVWAAGNTRGDVVLRDARVRGRLQLCGTGPDPEPGEIPEPQRSARIQGVLTLDAARISHVIVSGSTFDPDVAPAGAERTERGPVRLTAERARIGRMDIRGSLLRCADLSGTRVSRWDLPSTCTHEELLARTEPFHKSSYVAIENTLRNTGEEARADAVHVAMRRRDRGNLPWWRRMLDRVLDWTIAYGTGSGRLAFVMLLWFAVSAVLFSVPAHLEYAVPPLLQRPPPEVPPVDWGWVQSMLFSLRLHVPIISLGDADEFQPHGTLMRAYSVGTVALHWVMWPLLIASVSGVVRKRT